MRKVLPLKVVAIVVIGVLLGIGIARLTAQAAPAPAGHSPKWEYAQYSDISGVEFYAFTPPGKQLMGKTLSALYYAMTGKDPAKHAEDQSGDCSYLDIMNAAGADGWELIQSTVQDNAPLGKSHTFIFKRQIP
jgi:hypothetical protein